MTDLRDEDLMRRFLLEDLTPEEREHVEAAFFRDPAYFDALSAAEDELILLHLRSELPERWRDSFQRAILDSPARRRHVDDMRGLLAASVAAGAPPADGSRWWKRSPKGLGVLFTAAAAVLILAFGWLLRQDRPQPATASPAIRTGVTPGVVTLFLAPGLTRADLRQSNVFRIPAGAARVQFGLVVPQHQLAEMRIQLRPVDGAAIATATGGDLVVRDTVDGLAVTWPVPASLLGPGDYILTVSATPAPGRDPESVAKRFFSVVR